MCHREETTKLLEDVYDRQTKIKQNASLLESILVKAHLEAEFAWKHGATEAQMKDILAQIRKAQWRWDFSVAGHGSSFHAPVEIGRILSSGIHYAQEARIQLARVHAALGYNKPFEMPDVSSKEKAQAYIGLDMKQLHTEKQVFMQTVVPKWLEEAKKREASY